MEIKNDNRVSYSEERTLKDLKPNVAALLCYVAGWISGIIFLVLEQKNRYIRFHALQSIFVFGILTLAGIFFGSFPFVGGAFSAIIGITGFVLWILLMIKALNGEIFKMPGIGNLAERLASDSVQSSTTTISAAPVQPEPVADRTSQGAPEPRQTAIRSEETARPAAAEMKRPEKADLFRESYYSSGARSARTVGSAFAIAWAVILLVFFNFYNQYIAWYEPIRNGGSTTWQIHTVISQDFNLWLPVVTVTLVLTIIGHAALIVFDRYWLRQTTSTILDLLGAVTLISLLVIFPFDFSVLPSQDIADGVTLGVTITLIFMIIGFSISTLVKFIMLIVHAAQGKY